MGLLIIEVLTLNAPTVQGLRARGPAAAQSGLLPFSLSGLSALPHAEQWRNGCSSSRLYMYTQDQEKETLSNNHLFRESLMLSQKPLANFLLFLVAQRSHMPFLN